jgi:hypothetical protein
MLIWITSQVAKAVMQPNSSKSLRITGMLEAPRTSPCEFSLAILGIAVEFDTRLRLETFSFNPPAANNPHCVSLLAHGSRGSTPDRLHGLGDLFTASL